MDIMRNIKNKPAGPCRATGLKSVAMVIDAMENAKLKLPWLASRFGKEVTDLARAEQRVVAVIMPGWLEMYLIFGPEHAKGSCVTIECIVRALLALRDLLHEQGLRIEDQFEQLDIFADNASGENKNKMVRTPPCTGCKLLQRTRPAMVSCIAEAGTHESSGNPPPVALASGSP